MLGGGRVLEGSGCVCVKGEGGGMCVYVCDSVSVWGRWVIVEE